MIGTGVYQYDSRAPLACRTAERHIGVTATEPFHSNGLNAVCVEVNRYTLTVSGMAGGYVYPAETVMDEVRSATETTLAELEAVINELVGHRDRLRSELKVIDERDWDGD
jgi:hypothetical protein